MSQIRMHELTLLEIGPTGEAATASIRISPGELLSFGRTLRSDHAFPFDCLMSRVHFCIECREKSTILRDMRSKNGTFLNHQRIHFGRLVDGDLIIAGTTQFRFASLPMAAKEGTCKKMHRRCIPDSRPINLDADETLRQDNSE